MKTLVPGLTAGLGVGGLLCIVLGFLLLHRHRYRRLGKTTTAQVLSEDIYLASELTMTGRFGC